MSKVSQWLDWFYNHRFEIALFLCLVLLILYFIFKKPIDNYLKDKHDFTLPKSGCLRQKQKTKIITKKYEKQCRVIFEKIFNKPFPSVRPQFLKRSNGRCLELDGYNSELKLAFEYNGIQHYKFSPRFHRKPEDFTQQLTRDKDKRKLCKLHNVKVVEIPYNIKYDKLEAYIRLQLIKLGYSI